MVQEDLKGQLGLSQVYLVVLKDQGSLEIQKDQYHQVVQGDHPVHLDLKVHLVQEDLVVQKVLRVPDCLKDLCLQVALRVLLDPDFLEILEIREAQGLIQEVQHFLVDQMVLMVQENLAAQRDQVALVGQLTLVDRAALLDLKDLEDQVVQVALCLLGYQMVQKVPEAQMVLVVQLALGILQDLKFLMDLVGL